MNALALDRKLLSKTDYTYTLPFIPSNVRIDITKMMHDCNHATFSQAVTLILLNAIYVRRSVKHDQQHKAYTFLDIQAYSYKVRLRMRRTDWDQLTHNTSHCCTSYTKPPVVVPSRGTSVNTDILIVCADTRADACPKYQPVRYLHVISSVSQDKLNVNSRSMKRVPLRT